MDQIKDDIDDLVQTILVSQEVAGEYALEQSEEKLQNVEAEADEVRLDGAYERFLLEYIQQEREALQDGDRDEPLCTCSRTYCPVKRGRLPARMAGSSDLEHERQAFLREHDGDAVVLRDGRQAYTQKVSRVKSKLREVAMILRRDERRPEEATA